MTPYYEDDLVVLYNGKAIDVLPKLPRGLVVTDPPYNVGYSYDEYLDAMPERDYWDMIKGSVRVPLVFIHYPEALVPLAKKLRREPSEVVAWVYHANTPKQWRIVAWFGCCPDFSKDGQEYQNPDDRRVRQLIAAGKKARLYDWWHIEQVKNVNVDKTEHPCQIPLALMTRIIRLTMSDGPVIDPFCGSGTTLEAARLLGRKSIGIEMSERYCEIAANRLRQGALNLFGEATA